MWPFDDPETLKQERKRLEAQQRWRRFQFWKPKEITRRQPTLGERVASTYFPIAYVLGLGYLVYCVVWRKRQ
jgi:hypothetical protein